MSLIRGRPATWVDRFVRQFEVCNSVPFRSGRKRPRNRTAHQLSIVRDKRSGIKHVRPHNSEIVSMLVEHSSSWWWPVSWKLPSEHVDLRRQRDTVTPSALGELVVLRNRACLTAQANSDCQTTKAPGRGPRDATIATVMRRPRSLDRMVRPFVCRNRKALRPRHREISFQSSRRLRSRHLSGLDC